MYAKITTTITTEIDLDTFKPNHSVSIESETAGLPKELIYAAVAGACKATLKTVGDPTDEPENEEH